MKCALIVFFLCNTTFLVNAVFIPSGLECYWALQFAGDFHPESKRCVFLSGIGVWNFFFSVHEICFVYVHVLAVGASMSAHLLLSMKELVRRAHRPSNRRWPGTVESLLVHDHFSAYWSSYVLLHCGTPQVWATSQMPSFLQVESGFSKQSFECDCWKILNNECLHWHWSNPLCL